MSADTLVFRSCGTNPRRELVIEEILCLHMPLIFLQICMSALGVRNGGVQMVFLVQNFVAKIFAFSSVSNDNRYVFMCVCGLERGRGKGSL